MLSHTISQAETELPRLQAERHRVQAASSRARDTSGEKFALTVNGIRWSSRSEAAMALRNALAAIPPADQSGSSRPVQVGRIAGFDVSATARRYLEPHLVLELVIDQGAVPRTSITVKPDELLVDRPIGIVARFENKASDLDRILARITESEASIAAEADRARAEYGQPFGHQHALADARCSAGTHASTRTTRRSSSTAYTTRPNQPPASRAHSESNPATGPGSSAGRSPSNAAARAQVPPAPGTFPAGMARG